MPYKDEIIEGNKAILDSKYNNTYYPQYKEFPDRFYIETLRFHNDFSQIYGIVRSIMETDKIGFTLREYDGTYWAAFLQRGSTAVFIEHQSMDVNDSMESTIWKLVVLYIQRYTPQKQMPFS
jgi:hypothetical protein